MCEQTRGIVMARDQVCQVYGTVEGHVAGAGLHGAVEGCEEGLVMARVWEGGLGQGHWGDWEEG